MNYIKKFIYIVLSLLVLSFTLTSCEKKEEVIVFDDTYPLSLSPSVEWAVVREPYAAYKETVGWESSVTGHCRRGEILQVLGRSVDEHNERWCEFTDGWLPESCLNIYSNRLKAERVSEILVKSNKNTSIDKN